MFCCRGYQTFLYCNPFRKISNFCYPSMLKTTMSRQVQDSFDIDPQGESKVKGQSWTLAALKKYLVQHLLKHQQRLGFESCVTQLMKNGKLHLPSIWPHMCLQINYHINNQSITSHFPIFVVKQCFYFQSNLMLRFLVLMSVQK